LLSPEVLIRDPEWQPYRYDLEREALVFAHLPRVLQQRVTFLDHRYLPDVQRSQPVSAADLMRGAAGVQARPMHFIFHTAFCCSTLLARAFDQPGASMGLKEPQVLNSFAEAWCMGRVTANTEPAFCTVLDLLSRPLAPGEVQVVKPSNIANIVAGRILALRPQSKAIFLFSPLKDYLEASARKGAAGRAFNRDFFGPFHRAMPLDASVSASALADMQVAASLWLMQVRFLSEIAGRLGRERVQTLNANSFLAAPAETLERAGAFFEIPLPAPAHWQDVASGPIFYEHAKNLGTPYNAKRQKNDLAAAGQAHQAEIAAALDWANDIAQQAGAPLGLGDTLLGG
jgi:hypothetical protein